MAQGGLQTVALSGILDVPDAEPGEVALRATPDATLEAELANLQPVTVTITEPADHAGSHVLNPAVLAQGPACLIPPRLDGLAVAGRDLRLVPGLWVQDLTAAPMAVAREWRLDGTAFDHTATTLPLTTAHHGRTITCVETASDRHGTVVVETPARYVPHPGEMPDTFSAADGTLLSAYIGESGLEWDRNGATIQNGRLRTSTSGSYYIALRNQDLPAAQFVEAVVEIGSAPSDSGVGLIVRGDAASRTGYFLRRNAGAFIVGALVNGSVVGVVAAAISYPVGTEVHVRLEVRDAADLRLIVDGSATRTFTHGTAIASGRPGILIRGNVASGVSSELTQFHAGALV